MRLLILKHARDWSFAVLEREVRANVVHRHFTRISWEAVPDAKTLARIARALGPEVIERRGMRRGEADKSKDGSSADKSGAREWKGESAC